MEAEALELNGVQIRDAAIEVGPGIGARVVTVDASIVAVEELAIGVECGGVVIDVRSHPAAPVLISVQLTPLLIDRRTLFVPAAPDA